METLGNMSILDLHKVGYFASSTIATLSVMPTLDWASEVAKRDDVAVVSGFHSKLERQVLDFLLRGKCNIICVLARGIYRVVPDKFRDAYDAGRVLFVSNNKSTSSMTSRRMCQNRNEYVAEISDELVFSSITPESSLYPLSLTNKKITNL